MSHKLLSSLKLHFLKCLSLSTYWLPKKWPNYLHTICQKTLLTLIKCSLALFMFDNTGKVGQNLFFTENFAFFSQIFVISTNSLVRKNWSYYFHNNCQNTLWTLTNCSLTFVMFDILGTNRPKCSLYWKVCLFFWKTSVFNNLIGPKELILSLPQSLPEYLMDPYKLLPKFCHARYYKKTWSTIFLSLEFLPFFLNFLCFQELLMS